MIQELMGLAKNAATVLVIVLTLGISQAALCQTNESSASTKPDASRLKQTNAILIRKYMIQQGPEALLIQDRHGIEKLVNLLGNNRRVGHACGYHWLIWFRLSPTVAVPFSHNEDCEVYQNNSAQINSLLKRYSQLIKTKPSHFIHSLKIPASLAPEDAAQLLENNSQFVFCFSGTEQRLPHVRLQATSISKMPADRSQWEAVQTKNVASAERQLQNAIEGLRHRYEIESITKFDKRYSMSGDGRFEDRVETTVYFPYQTTLENIENLLNGVEILEKKVPTSYDLKLVSEERFSEKVKQRLTNAYPFLLDVLPFPE
jgi:hypothetical protein